MSQRIAIRELRLPAKEDKDDDIKWLVKSLCLSTNRDLEDSAIKVFKLFLDAASKNTALGSTDIARELDLTRGAVLHHLKRLEDSGLIVRTQRRYALKGSGLEEAIETMERDMERMLARVRKIASDIDDEFGIERRW